MIGKYKSYGWGSTSIIAVVYVVRIVTGSEDLADHLTLEYGWHNGNGGTRYIQKRTVRLTFF